MAETSIYKSTEGKAILLGLYDSVLDSLGIEYEERMVETRFGSTHILVSGPKNAPPVILLHGGNSFAPLTLASMSTGESFPNIFKCMFVIVLWLI